MDNGNLKFVLVAGLAFYLLTTMSRGSELFKPYESSSAYEQNASYSETKAVKKAVKKATKKAAKKAAKGAKKGRKSALLKATGAVAQPQGTSANLLPKPAADAGFGQFAPDPAMLSGQNFVDASRWVSLGSMSSRRNINRDIRAEVPIPKSNGLSPWNQSSIEQQKSGKALDCP